MSRLSVGEWLVGRLGIALGYGLVVLIWGTTWYGVQTQVNGTAPHVSVVLRLGCASLVFFGMALATGQSLRLAPRQLVLVVVQGFCFFGFNYIAVYTASQHLTSGVLAVLFSITVPFNIIADRIISGARARLRTVLAALTGIVGIALVFSSELEHALAADNALLGAALAVCAAVVVAVGNVLAARFASLELGAIRLNAFGLAAGTLLILLWGLVSGAAWSLQATPSWLAGFAYLTVIGSVVAFGVYMKILPAVGPVAGAYVVVLSPVLALGISTVLEGLSLGINSIVGVILLLTGHSMLVLQRRRAPAEASPDSEDDAETTPG
jgi:drug/metabolite transporter (DMT)-like permease